MDIAQNLYGQAKMDAKQIVEISTQLEFLSSLAKQKALQEDKISEDYEYRRRRDIKNFITNIYLTLELQGVKGMADEIFNSEFEPK